MFYRPRDIVSGDFPWLYEKGDDVYIAAIDCTGHGVPGAMLSLIGYFIMNQILRPARTFNPGEILTICIRGFNKPFDRIKKEPVHAMEWMLLCVNSITKTMESFSLQEPTVHYIMVEMENCLNLKAHVRLLEEYPKKENPNPI
jgi:hypothetical protein